MTDEEVNIVAEQLGNPDLDYIIDALETFAMGERDG